MQALDVRIEEPVGDVVLPEKAAKPRNACRGLAGLCQGGWTRSIRKGRALSAVCLLGGLLFVCADYCLGEWFRLHKA